MHQSGGAESRLREVALARAPYRELARIIVTETANEHFSSSQGKIAEIGAGDGQLLPLLPPPIQGRIIHIEPLASARRLFEKHHPDAELEEGLAEALPFEDEALDGVMSSCVLDIVEDLPAVVREAARVLRPGGRFIHFLDLNAHPGELFRELKKAKLVPLPNVFSDANLSKYPDDVAAFPHRTLREISARLKLMRAGQEAPLEAYLAVHRPDSRKEARGLTEYEALSKNPLFRARLLQLFQTALSDEELRPEFFSTSRAFSEKLEETFTRGQCFEVRENGIRSRVQSFPPWEDNSRTQFRSMRVGLFENLPRVPARHADPSRAALGGGRELRELGMHVFVATKVGRLPL